MRSISVFATVLLAAACGGKSTPAPAAAPSEPAEVTVPEGMKFDDMNHDQRLSFMKNTVLPRMKELFQAFDATEFAEFNCKTCHGSGAEDGTFEMPTPDIEVLPGSEEAFVEYAKEPEHQRFIKFMSEQVKPEMAKLLQEPEYDPATGQGEFSCGNCHTFEGQPAPAGDH
jgi:mono/diheme cytochrome c family protein